MVEEAAEDGMPLEVMVTSGQERTLDRARTPSRDDRIYLVDREIFLDLDAAGQKSRILEVRVRMENGERIELGVIKSNHRCCYRRFSRCHFTPSH